MAYEKNTYVRVRITPAGSRQSLPAANWLTGERTVKLLDYAPGENTLDVLDVEAVIDGRKVEESIYDFNIIGPAPVRGTKAAKAAHADNVENALLTGLARAQALGYTKPVDIATSLLVALDAHGLTVSRKAVRQ